MRTLTEKRFFEWEEDDISVTLRSSGGVVWRRFGSPCHMLYQRTIGALCADDYRGPNRQYVDQDKLIVEGRMTFSDIAATRSAQDGRGGVHTQMIDNPTENFVLEEPYTSSKASYHQRFVNDGKAETLVATDYKDPPIVTDVHAEDVSVDEDDKCAENANLGDSAGVVRRLTPLECTRLQGFPDGWVDIGDWVDTNGKLHKESDTAKYKALGNSIALPYWFYILRRISAQYERPATLGSMFSGIGGFDLCWTKCNGVGSVRWSSEIEEFPMAVMRKHFGIGDIPGDVKEYL